MRMAGGPRTVRVRVLCGRTGKAVHPWVCPGHTKQAEQAQKVGLWQDQEVQPTATQSGKYLSYA